MFWDVLCDVLCVFWNRPIWYIIKQLVIDSLNTTCCHSIINKWKWLTYLHVMEHFDDYRWNWSISFLCFNQYDITEIPLRYVRLCLNSWRTRGTTEIYLTSTTSSSQKVGEPGAHRDNFYFLLYNTKRNNDWGLAISSMEHRHVWQQLIYVQW